MMTRFRHMVLMIFLLLAGQMAAQVPVLDTICSGATRYYRVFGEEGSTYSWILTMPDSTIITLPSDADTIEITWEYTPGTYELQVLQHPENGCESEAVYGHVIIVESPDVFAGPDGAICETDFYKLAFATAEHTSSIAWQTAGDGTFDDTTWLNPTYYPGPGDIAAGGVELTLTGYGLGLDGTCDPAVSSMMLGIIDEVIPEFGQLGPLCQYAIPPPLPDTSINGITGSWEPDTINTSVPGEFFFTFTPDSGSCAVPTEISIFVGELPEAYAGADQTIPVYGNTNIPDATASGGTGPLNFSWSPGTLLIDSTVLHPWTIGLDETTVFTLTVTDSIGCSSSDEMIIYVQGGPLVINPVADPDTICFGETVQLYAYASGGSGSYTYSWASNPSGFTSYIANPEANPLVTTTYILEVYDGYVTVTDSVTVTVYPLPQVYAGEDQIIPSGTSTTISDATASGAEPLIYDWTPASLLIDPTELNPVTVDLFSTTTFTLMVIDSNGCVNSDEMTVYVSGGPLTVAPTVEPGAICLYEPAQLFANAGGGSGNYTYSWTSVPAGFSSTEANPVVSPLVTTVYTVEIMDGFDTVSGSVTLVVHPLPEVYAGADQTITYNTSTTISDATASGAEPMTYDWTPAGLLIDPTVLHPTTVALVANTTFTLTVIDANGCVNSDEVTIFIEMEPLIVDPTVTPEAVCQGDTAQLFANASGGSGHYTYSWTSDPAGFTSTEENPLVSPLVTTTYYVEVSDTIGTSMGSVTLVVHPLPEVYAGADQTIPYGTFTMISDATASGTEPLSYYWMPDSLLVDPTVLNPTTLILDTNTVFTLVVIDSNGCSNSDDMIVFVTGDPLAVYPIADPDEICLGEMSQLFANPSGGSGVYTFSWTSNPAGFTSTEENPWVAPTESTAYSVEVFDGYQKAIDSVTVIVNPLPVFDCPEYGPVCQGSEVITFMEPGVFKYNGEIITQFNPIVPGSYSITYIETTPKGCSDSCEFEIIVNPLPDVYAGADQTILEGSSTIIADATASGTEPLFITWTPSALLLDPTVLNPVTVDLDTTTVFTLSVVDSNGCDNSDQVTIYVEPPPDSLQAITGPDDLCLGSSANIPVKVDNFLSVANFQMKLSYNVDKLYCLGRINTHPELDANLDAFIDTQNGIIILEWHSGAEVTFPSIATVTELVFDTKEPGLGELDWYTTATESYFTDLAGTLLPVEFFAGAVTIYNPPEIFLPATMPVCVGDPVEITGIAQGTNPPLTYLWTYPNGDTSNTDPFIDSVTLADAGDYTLLVTDAKGCTDQKSIKLLVFPNPVALFHGTDSMQVQAGYILEAGHGMASYLWNTGETTENIEINADGMYTVEMISEAGCEGIDSVYMEIIRKCLDVPNAFTPDGDGLNDFFEAVTVCPITYFKMMIFNRWGEKIFESEDISQGWDGRKNGVECPGDSYVYMINYVVQKSPGVEEDNVKTGILVLLK